ncbi:MAG: hypothetical protein WCF23_22405 [Candidatus Nitrosopolaris sp.]
MNRQKLECYFSGKSRQYHESPHPVNETPYQIMNGLDDTNSMIQAYCMGYNLKENNPTIFLRVIIGCVVNACSRRNWANNEHLS